MPNVQELHKLDITPSTEHLGVMVDVGRHYFPIYWLKVLVDFLEKLHFNMIHLRLTNDESFSVRLESHPELAMPAPQDTRVYSVEDLEELVKYAKKRGFAIVPEIHMPGYAGSWHGIPGLLVPCPNYACLSGRNIPLNTTNPQLLPILRDVIQEVKEIFDTSPYLHLGDYKSSEECYQEVGMDMPDPSLFEYQLEDILTELEIPLDNVLRYGDDSVIQNDTDKPSSFVWSSNSSDAPLFASLTDLLSMDANGDANGWDIYQHTLTKITSTTMMTGASELHPRWWGDRNVWGRLIAVAMGTSKDIAIGNEEDFIRRYQKLCTQLGLEQYVCELFGRPTIPTEEWNNHRERHTKWLKDHICERLTVPHKVRAMNVPAPVPGSTFATRQEEEISRARKIFAQRYSERKEAAKKPLSYDRNQFGHLQLSEASYRDKPVPNIDAIFTHISGHTGVMVDTTRFFYPMERLKAIVEWLSMLGFNTLHLRVVGDSAFAMKLHCHPNLAWASKDGGSIYTWSDLKELSDHAYDFGVQIFPEINVISRAGGWYNGGFLSPCRKHVCSQGYGIPLNLTNTPMMAVISNVIDESRFLFNSPFLHLGYDERAESMPCFEEGGIADVNFDAVEQKLTTLVSILDIPSRFVIRWESSDTDAHEPSRKRAGLVTHYHLTNPPANETNPFIVTTDLRFNDASQLEHDDGWIIFKKTRAYAQHENVLGILAGTLELSPQSWSALNVDGKLIAMAIGASDKATDIYTRKEFERIYNKACNVMEFPTAMCKLLGRSRLSTEYWERERDQQRELRRNTTCDRLTGWLHFHQMKPELLTAT